jgi:hypothetical protein
MNTWFQPVDSISQPLKTGLIIPAIGQLEFIIPNTFARFKDSLFEVIIAILAGKKKAQEQLYNAKTGTAIFQEEINVIKNMDIIFTIALPISRVLRPILSSKTPLGNINNVEASPPILITNAFWFAVAPISDK